ncbi:CD1375 family protein [Brevibacillus laterosporus]
MTVLKHIVKAYAYLIKAGRREIESLPEIYQTSVAEHLVQQEEQSL